MQKDHTQSLSVKRCQPQTPKRQWKELLISPSDLLLSVSHHDNKPLKGKMRGSVENPCAEQPCREEESGEQRNAAAIDARRLNQQVTK